MPRTDSSLSAGQGLLGAATENGLGIVKNAIYNIDAYTADLIE
jgi:hypothetical protein